MRELDKAAMGRRIRQIRLGASLRQWELAKLLGTTQSAVHKYEHGVVPEPRRLVELARIGGTSIEWVLTGQHWENGSEDQERISPELLATACILKEISEEGRATVNEALRIVRDAVLSLEPDGAQAQEVEQAAVVASLREHSPATLRLLKSAWRIQQAVLRRVAEDADVRLERSKIFLNRRKPSIDGDPASNPAAGPSGS
jgi:transcriptional regulator with XRE-family HTH domain